MIKAILFDFSRVLLNAKDVDYSGSLNALYKHISQTAGFNSLDHFAFNKDLLDFATGLKDKYALYIITTGTIQEDVHLKSFIEHVFKKIFTVEEIGFPKDNQAAYGFIANAIALNPAEILFIDDTEENIKAASEAGLKTIQFESTALVIKEIKAYLLNYY